MPRNFKVYLEDILEATAKIRQFTVGFTLEKFSADTKTFDAVIRNLEIIIVQNKLPPLEKQLRRLLAE